MEKKLEDQKIKRDLQQDEVNKNYKFFKENYNEIKKKYSHKNFVLLKNQKVVGAFDSWDDARVTAGLLYKNETYSIQELKENPQHLGYQSYALL